MVAFEVDRFDWTEERLVVSGRWYGLRGHRFVRPALTVEVDESAEERRRMLADLEHKPWAADEGTDWIAAFPWDGEPVQLARAELAVAPSVAIDLPVPRVPGSGRKRSSRRPARGGGRDGAAERERLAAERDALRRDLDSLAAERDALRRELDSLARERDEAIADRDRLARDHRSLVAERDRLPRERDAAAADRDRLAHELAAAAADRDRLAHELGAALRARDAAVRARSAAVEERDSARAARQEDLEALEGQGPRPLPPRPITPSLRRRPAPVVWAQRFVAVVALGVLAFVVYTLLAGVV